MYVSVTFVALKL